ncbi:MULTISPECIES: hypothetical protein [unclassified Streptomyces]|uniref:hypothetical protein n=1 Tax=unclassified Streptomyces TaxID=2593676 RepID=UPI00380E8A77
MRSTPVSVRRPLSAALTACGAGDAATGEVKPAGRSEITGTLSGAGDGLRGRAATTKKGSGRVGAYAVAIDHIVRTCSYAGVLARRGLTGEAVTKPEINPPGLPGPRN